MIGNVSASGSLDLKVIRGKQPQTVHPDTCACKGRGRMRHDVFNVQGGSSIDVRDDAGELLRIDVEALADGKLALHLTFVCRNQQNEEVAP